MPRKILIAANWKMNKTIKESIDFIKEFKNLINNNNEISETAEKRPISKNAIAGFYYFKKGSDFVEAAMKMIEKDANINEFYYIAPSLNEMILKGKKLSAYPVGNDKYHTFYTPHKVEEYEKKLNLRKG